MCGCYVHASQEVERLGREKRELRAQYAREIEAAQAELGEKHSSMGQEYLQKLQLLKEQHQLGNFVPTMLWSFVAQSIEVVMG